MYIHACEVGVYVCMYAMQARKVVCLVHIDWVTCITQGHETDRPNFYHTHPTHHRPSVQSSLHPSIHTRTHACIHPHRYTYRHAPTCTMTPMHNSYDGSVRRNTGMTTRQMVGVHSLEQHDDIDTLVVSSAMAGHPHFRRLDQ